MNKKIALLLGLVPSVLLAVPVMAQTAAVTPDAATGLQLARALCTNCHMVEPGGQTALADVPPFMAIARRPGQTADRIQGFIMHPHPPMPEIQLTRQDLANLAAYIQTLAAKK
jgi:cytochrome c